jgi:DNA-binding PucR family transcriptional regulator
MTPTPPGRAARTEASLASLERQLSTGLVSAADHPHADLEPPPAGDWQQLRPPPGWLPMSRVCRRAADGMLELSARIRDRMIGELHSYRRAGAPPDDIFTSAFRTSEAILLGVAERRDPTPAELHARGDLGRRRAEQGVDLDDVMRAFHIFFREMWVTLLSEAEGDPEASALLAAAATIAWSWTEAITTAVAEAHKQVLPSREVVEIEMGTRMLELVVLGDLRSDELAMLARNLGFDEAGTFQGVRIKVSREDDRARAHRLKKALGQVAGTHLCQFHGDSVAVLTQRSSMEHLLSTVRRYLPDEPVGVGLTRAHLVGARLSLSDADLAAAISDPGEITLFEDHWFDALVGQNADRLRAVVAPGLDALAANPMLEETLQAYLRTGFSKAETAKHLSVHVHTMSNRLERWKTLTGWDVSSYRGLVRTAASLRLAQADQGPGPPPRGGESRG